eukprot:633746-Prymnesium_polylepis.1
MVINQSSPTQIDGEQETVAAPSVQAGGRRGFRVDSRQQPRFPLPWATTACPRAPSAAFPTLA